MKAFKTLCIGLLVAFVFGCEDDNSAVPPVVTGFAPSGGFVGTLLTISGGNFGDAPKVFINDTEMTVTHAADDQLQVSVPEFSSSGPIRVENHGKSTTTTQQFTVFDSGNIVRVRAYNQDGAEVEVVSPGQVVAIEISGAVPEGAKFFFDDKELVNVVIGPVVTGIIPPAVHSGKFKFVANGATKMYDKKVTVLEGSGSWNLDVSYPGGIIPNPVNFSIGERYYYGIGDDLPKNSSSATGYLNQEFYSFDPAESKWTELPSFPAALPCDNLPTGIGSFSFSIGNYGYANGGFNRVATSCKPNNALYKFFRFDPSSNSWAPRDSLSSNVASSDYGYSAAGRGFVIDFETASAFEYDVANDTFRTKMNVPFGIPSVIRHTELEGKAYFIVSISGENSTRLWQYDPIDDSWTMLAGIQYSRSIYIVAIDGRLYLGSDSWFVRYDGSGNFSRMPPPPVRLDGPSYSYAKNGYILDTKGFEFPNPGYSRTYRFVVP